MAADPAIRIVPIGPGDDERLRALIAGLDDTSLFRRYFTGGVDLDAAVRWAAHPEQAGAVGLLALAGDEVAGHGVLVPSPEPGDPTAEVAFEVAAPWRRHGIASRLLEALLVAAAARGMTHVGAEVLAENLDMIAVFREHGASLERADGSVLRATLPVTTAAAPPPPDVSPPRAR
jgi:acetyltransferase